jgi:hypothetical protein
MYVYRVIRRKQYTISLSKKSERILVIHLIKTHHFMKYIVRKAEISIKIGTVWRKKFLNYIISTEKVILHRSKYFIVQQNWRKTAIYWETKVKCNNFENIQWIRFLLIIYRFFYLVSNFEIFFFIILRCFRLLANYIFQIWSKIKEIYW